MIFRVIKLIKNHSRKKSHDTDVPQRKKRERTFESLPESVYCATSKRKIIVPGGAAGLQIRLGPPAVPGRFDSCDLPPISLYQTLPTSTKPLVILYISSLLCILRSTSFNLHQAVFGGSFGGVISLLKHRHPHNGKNMRYNKGF